MIFEFFIISTNAMMDWSETQEKLALLILISNLPYKYYFMQKEGRKVIIVI